MRHLIKNYWLFIVTFLIALTLWVTNTNHDLFFIINHQHDWLPDSVWKAIISFTSEKNGILPLILILLTYFFRRDKIWNVLLLVISYYVLFYLLKITVSEPRPYIQHTLSSFYWITQPDVTTRAFRSFPSGHTGNVAIFVFAIFHLFAQNKLWLRLLLLICLLFTMLAQICTGWHFPIDVLSSALIGFLLACFCFSPSANNAILFCRKKINLA